MSSEPLVLDVAHVLSQAGVRHPQRFDAPLPGVQISSAKILADEPIRLDLVIEAQGADVIVAGTVQATWHGECRRCLEPTQGQVVLELREIYSENPVEGEIFPYDGERLDLGPMLREAFTLALPLVPLCRESCPGPAPEKHPVGTGDEASGPPQREDDPWAALDQIRFD